MQTFTSFDGTLYNVHAAAGHYDYDWSEIKILERVSDGAFFIGSDCGCSCTYFGDHLDLKPVANLRGAKMVFTRIKNKYNYKVSL